MKKLIFVFLFSLVSFTQPVYSGGPDNIRVAILKNVSSVSVAVPGPFEIVDGVTSKIIYSEKYLTKAQAGFVPTGFKLSDKIFSFSRIVIRSKKAIPISLNNRKYRGDVVFIKDSSGTMLVVNTLDLESYIKGVLYHEISNKWPMDVIKAQAVACRTYATYQKEVMAFKDYDVAADTSSQVYGGYMSEQDKTNRAVNFTHGEILKFQGKVFPAYFHATCAGTTEDASELWKTNIKPLRGGQKCSFCSDSPHYEWVATLSLKMIQNKLSSFYKLNGNLVDISVADKNKSGRIRTILLKDDLGGEVRISAKDFRQILGPDIVRSTNFSISSADSDVILNGLGWGHGVGLCQWGAKGMASAGYTYKQILEFYYPGADIVKAF